MLYIAPTNSLSSTQQRFALLLKKSQIIGNINTRRNGARIFCEFLKNFTDDLFLLWEFYLCGFKQF